MNRSLYVAIALTAGAAAYCRRSQRISTGPAITTHATADMSRATNTAALA